MTPRGTLLIGWGAEKEWSKMPEQDLPAFYLPDFFFKSAQPWKTFENTLEIEFPAKKPEIALHQNICWKEPAKRSFIDSVNHVQQWIRTGKLCKAVPYAFAHAQHAMTAESIKQVFFSALEYAAKNHTYPYGYWNQNEGILGVTPEVLLSQKVGHIETAAVAGTARKPHSPDEKLMIEHQLVVDDICACLAPFAAVDKGSYNWACSGSIYHLKTPITAQLSSETSFEKLVRLLHPTAALGAVPREMGSVWLAEQEMIEPRGRFGAPFGYYCREKNEGLSYVAIRNVQWSGLDLRIGAGCGVIAASEPELEWEEWRAKFASVRETTKL